MTVSSKIAVSAINDTDRVVVFSKFTCVQFKISLSCVFFPCNLCSQEVTTTHANTASFCYKDTIHHLKKHEGHQRLQLRRVM